jgi:hypothetical protein
MKATLRDLVPRRRLPNVPLAPLRKPLWWRALRWCVVRYLAWTDRCIREELEGRLAMAEAGGYQLGKEFVHNCTVQREALRDQIARWNR